MKNEKVKKIFITVCIAIIFIITCCCCIRQHINDSGIVIGVEEINTNLYSNKKFRITVGQEFNTRFKANCYIYTDTLYQVGDTIKIR